MKEWQKKVLVFCFCAVVWGVLTTIGVFWLIDSFKPYEITKDIELPGNYKIVNKVDGRNLPIDDVRLSGTAVYVPYRDYISTNFYKKENDVIIQSNGTVYYLIKEAGKTFFTKRDYRQWTKDSRVACVEVMIDGLKVKTSFSHNHFVIVSLGIVIAVVWGIVIQLVYPPLKKVGEKISALTRL